VVSAGTCNSFKIQGRRKGKVVQIVSLAILAPRKVERSLRPISPGRIPDNEDVSSFRVSRIAHVRIHRLSI
jgi:hypothetical protein